MKQADQLAEAIEEMQPGFLVNKVYFDAYKRSSLGTYPDVHNEIEKLLKSGQLLMPIAFSPGFIKFIYFTKWWIG